MSEEQVVMAPAPIEQIQVHLLAEDTPEVRAQKAWQILNGQGPVNPTFQKILEAYLALDKQAWEKDLLAVPAETELMAG